MRIRYIKVENVHMARRGKFAWRDLRVFGYGDGELPAQVEDFAVGRHEDDPRNGTFRWTPPHDAKGVLIWYGLAPDALHLNLQY